MARKITDGHIRNKGRTKLKLIDAVAKIIQTGGYTKLGINHIAHLHGLLFFSKILVRARVMTTLTNKIVVIDPKRILFRI